jgi:hypothetical protein
MNVTQIVRNSLAKVRNAFRQLALKDWFSTILSLLAFIVSGLSLWLSNFRQVDDLRLILPDQRPFFSFSADEETLDYAADYKLLLLNSGNRPIAISQIQFSVHQDVNAQRSHCSDVGPSFHITPFVIKPGELVVQDIVLKGSGEDHQPLTVNPRPAEGIDTFTACLVFDVATPDLAKTGITVPVASTLYVKRTKASPVTPGLLYDPRKPIQIFRS